jgi:hypothetical protein
LTKAAQQTRNHLGDTPRVNSVYFFAYTFILRSFNLTFFSRSRLPIKLNKKVDEGLSECGVGDQLTFHRNGGTREVAPEPPFAVHDILVSGEEFERFEPDSVTSSSNEKAGILLPNMDCKCVWPIASR